MPNRAKWSVHFLPQLLEALLVLDAEPLFLVDYHESEVLEADIGADEAVRAHDHVHAARREAGEDALLFGGGAKAAQRLDRERVLRDALAKRAVVLLRQNGGRTEDRHLLAVVHGFERRPHRQLGLAVAHVAADEPVHRPRPQHVGLDLRQRGQLVRRLTVRERGLELGLPLAVRGECVARLRIAQRLEVDHLAGEVEDGGADLVFAALPTDAAEFRQLRVRLRRTDVFLD
jgi:hypothetical protein